MSRYGKIESGFWHNPKVRGLSEEAKFLLLYLLSCPHGNAAGCFVLPDGYVAADLSWPIETVSERFAELFGKGLAERDEGSFLLRIIGWWGHNNIENANVAKHVAKEIQSLPNCPVKQRLIDHLLTLETIHQTVRQTLSERLGKPVRNQEHNPTQPEPNKKSAGARAPRVDLSKEFGELWSEYPKREGANPRKTALKAFEVAVGAGHDPQAIIAGAKRYAAECSKPGFDRKFVAQLVTWIHQCRWEDYAADQQSNGVSCGFRAAFGSPEWEAWFAHTRQHGPKFVLSQMEQVENIGTGSWNFQTQWPPGHQGETAH